MLKLSDKITRARRWSWYLAGVLLLAACDVQSPVAVPTTAPTPGIAESEVTATAPAVEGTQTITETAAPDAEATTERVMAPTFDPTQTQIAVQPVIEGFERPLYLTHANDGSGRMFVVEKGGRIRIVADGEIIDPAFLDISTKVNASGSEQGLLGLAFPPNFSESGHFFVNYTDAAGDTVISRFQLDGANPNVADPGSEFFVLRFDQPASNHNGGMLTFGPDGYLWIGTGDGGAANNRFGNAQNPDTYLAKMLRIDVTSDPSVPYTIPADNPWVNADLNGVDVRDEIWADGLRNPWRYSFDRATGDLWIADVGQNQYEEVNFTPAGSPGGLNYGWSIMEGNHCFQSSECDSTGLELPIAEYDHAGGHCSITGGYVYRGSASPELAGVYLFGDYCSGVIWAVTPNADGSWNSEVVLESDVMISSFGEDEAGELYITDLSSGTIYQVVTEE